MPIFYPGFVANKYDPAVISLLAEKGKIMKRPGIVFHYSALQYLRRDPSRFIIPVLPNLQRTPFFMEPLSGNSSEKIPQNHCNSVG